MPAMVLTLIGPYCAAITESHVHALNISQDIQPDVQAMGAEACRYYFVLE